MNKRDFLCKLFGHEWGAPYFNKNQGTRKCWRCWTTEFEQKIIFRVDMVKTDRGGTDTFIIGVDDFKPEFFESENAAVEWITKRTFGDYAVTKIYSKK